jgi:FAD/FMN-containing dehydrogenase
VCEKCEELDGRINHYRQIARGVSDKLALEGIEQLIRDMEAKKRELHPERLEG